MRMPVSGAVRSVLTACREDDPETKLANYTISEGRTLIRLRPGGADGAESMDGLRRAIAARLPLADSISCSASHLDGTVEASIEVPSRSGERRAARRLATRGCCAQALLISGSLLLVVGLLALCGAK